MLKLVLQKLLQQLVMINTSFYQDHVFHVYLELLHVMLLNLHHVLLIMLL